MKIKLTHDVYDQTTQKVIKAGSTIDIKPEPAKVIISRGLAEAVKLPEKNK